MKPKNRKEEMKAISLHMEEMQPRLRLSESNLKEIKNWDVGKKYKLTLEVTMEFKEKEDGEKVKGGFKVNNVQAN